MCASTSLPDSPLLCRDNPASGTLCDVNARKIVFLKSECYYSDRNIFLAKMTNSYRLSVVIEKDADGYFAFCPELQGCYTQGESYEEVLENIKDAIRLHIEDRLEEGEVIPHIEAISLTSVEVAV